MPQHPSLTKSVTNEKETRTTKTKTKTGTEKRSVTNRNTMTTKMEAKTITKLAGQILRLTLSPYQSA